MLGFLEGQRSSVHRVKPKWCRGYWALALLCGVVVAAGCVREFAPEKKEFQCSDEKPCVTGYSCIDTVCIKDPEADVTTLVDAQDSPDIVLTDVTETRDAEDIFEILDDIISDISETTEPEPLGIPCATDEDCDQGICIEGPDGLFCSVPCGNCPSGWTCTEEACVPDAVPVCSTCSENIECSPVGRCASDPEGTNPSLCLVICDPDRETCGEGFTCAEHSDAEAGGPLYV